MHITLYRFCHLKKKQKQQPPNCFDKHIASEDSLGAMRTARYKIMSLKRNHLPRQNLTASAQERLFRLDRFSSLNIGAGGGTHYVGALCGLLNKLDCWAFPTEVPPHLISNLYPFNLNGTNLHKVGYKCLVM